MGSLAAMLTRSARPDPAWIDRMLAASPHRGADVSHWAYGDAILAVSNQPDHIDSTLSIAGELGAVFSGRLDNTGELAKAVTALGFPPTSTKPADILVSAFRAFGPDAPERMRGEFAAVVTDGRQMWCIRDHLGLRPLFYRDEPRAFFAATEIKQVMAGADLAREPNLEVSSRSSAGGCPRTCPALSRE